MVDGIGVLSIRLQRVLIVYMSANAAQDLGASENFLRCEHGESNSWNAHRDAKCIFLLTFFSKNLIYESHCDFFESQNLMLGRINR